MRQLYCAMFPLSDHSEFF